MLHRRFIAPGPVSASLPAAADIDLNSPEVSSNPFPYYESLRRSGTVHYLPRHNFWIVLGYKEAKRALSKYQIFSSQSHAPIDAVLLGADPPGHTAVRRVMSRFFSPEAVDRLIASAEQRAAELIRPEFDVVRGYAIPLAAHVAAKLTGLTADALAEVLAVEEQVRNGEIAPGFTTRIDALDQVSDRSALYQALIDTAPDLFSDAEARSLVRLTWLAATVTTERAIASAILTLLQNDALRTELRGPAQRSAFVEEVLRLHPPETLIPRVTNCAIRLGNVDIPAGARVQVCVAAANRDPAEFEDPAVLRLDRHSTHHLTFSAGIHKCLGAGLGRRVIATALAGLLREAPRFEAAEPLSDVTYVASSRTHSPSRLMVRM